MLLSFPHSNPVELAFKVGIAGTQAVPSSVALVLEKDGRSLSYAATRNGEDWVARVDNPGAVFGAGEVKLGIHVIVNNRIFTPFKSAATIEPLPEAVVTPAPEPVAQPEPAPTAEAVAATSKPADTKAADSKPADSTAADTKAADAKAADTKAADSNAATTQAADDKAADSKPEDDAAPAPKAAAKTAAPAPAPTPKVQINMQTREEMVKQIVSSVVEDLGGSLLKSVDVAPTPRKRVKEAAEVKAPKVAPKLFKLKKLKVIFR